ncbi:MAG: hypothetical protein B7Z83_05420, partial [Thiomonas sp. 20-64-5]
FFLSAWQRHQNGGVLTPLELIAADWMALHPEYHAELSDPHSASRDYAVEQGRTNPFLHLSMHLSIAEQVSIDQPPGIRQAFELLRSRLDEHDAHHVIMDCLGEMLWTAQRSGLPPDGAAYVDCVQRRATAR